MNPIVWVHFVAAAIVVLLAQPLVRRKVPRNRWYGVRIPASLASDEACFDINAYGGRSLQLFGALLATMAAAGACVPRAHWVIYNLVALVVSGAGLATFLFVVRRDANGRRPRP